MLLQRLFALAIDLLKENEVQTCLEMLQELCDSEVISSISCSLEDIILDWHEQKLPVGCKAHTIVDRHLRGQAKVWPPLRISASSVDATHEVPKAVRAPEEELARCANYVPEIRYDDHIIEGSSTSSLQAIAEEDIGDAKGTAKPPTDTSTDLASTRWLPGAYHGGFIHRVFLLFEAPMESKLGRVIDIGVLVTIIASTIAFILETIPEFRHRPAECGRLQELNLPLTTEACEPVPDSSFAVVEAICVVIFSVDYLARMLTVHSSDLPGSNGFIRTLRYAAQFLNVVDFIAVAPFYVELILGGGSGAALRIIRLARILRLLKLGKHNAGVKIVLEVFELSRQPLLILVALNCIVVVLFASIIFYTEGQRFSVESQWLGDHPTGVYVRQDSTLLADEVTPFRSIPYAGWWVCVTMTTVGYGDYSPSTIVGKLVGVVSFYVGMIFLALPITVLSSNFQLVIESKMKTAASSASDKSEQVVNEVAMSICKSNKDAMKSRQKSMQVDKLRPSQSVAIVPTYRWQTFISLEDEESGRFAKIWSLFMMGTTMASVIAIIFESMPGFNDTPSQCSVARPTVADCTPVPRPVFGIVEVVSIVIFTVDYALRAATVHAALPSELGFPPELGKCAVTLYYMKKPMNAIDVAAILPFYFERIVGKGGGLGVLRVLRLIRVFRILKTPTLRSGANMLLAVVLDSAIAIIGVFLATILICSFFASCIYFAEGTNYSVDPVVIIDYPQGAYIRPTADGHGIEPTPFSSILYSFWWFFVTACTVGYGDDYPTTTAGRMIGIIVFFVGILLIAIVMTVISANFMNHYPAWVSAFQNEKCKKEYNGVERQCLGQRHVTPGSDTKKEAWS